MWNKCANEMDNKIMEYNSDYKIDIGKIDEQTNSKETIYILL